MLVFACRMLYQQWNSPRVALPVHVVAPSVLPFTALKYPISGNVVEESIFSVS